MKTADLSIEYKYTDKASYSLKKAELATAEKYALLDGRTMMFGISFAGANYILMTEADLHTLYEGGDLSWR